MGAEPQAFYDLGQNGDAPSNNDVFAETHRSMSSAGASLESALAVLQRNNPAAASSLTDLTLYNGKNTFNQRNANADIGDRSLSFYNPFSTNSDSRVDFSPNIINIRNSIEHATAHLQDVAGHLFKGRGGAAKIQDYVDQMVNWNDERVKDGLQGPGHERIAQALYKLARVYEVVPTGSAAQLSQATVDRHIENTLALLARPDVENNQTGDGNILNCCSSSSSNYIKERIHPEAVGDEIAALLTTGEWVGFDGRTASFTVDELKHDTYWGVKAPSYFLAATDYKLSWGEQYELTNQSGGLNYLQQADNYYSATRDALPFADEYNSGEADMKMYMFAQGAGRPLHSVVIERRKDHNTGKYYSHMENWVGGWGEGAVNV